VHPRPDARHITWDDVFALSALMQGSRPTVEFNIEGRPSDDFVDRVVQVRPAQVIRLTLGFMVDEPVLGLVGVKQINQFAVRIRHHAP
jgi:hypothetical protein